MNNYLHNKKILIGITGGIAAYKILELIRRLKERGAQVQVVMSQHAEQFITPLSLEALGAQISVSSAMQHIDLARWAQVILVAPATANVIAKVAHGLADDLLTTLLLATTAPTLIAPAMNQQMWANPATQENIKILNNRSIKILGPNSGLQACGENGPGRMLEAEELLAALEQHFTPKLLHGKRIVITAGPTQESIDPVRFISNRSSGKMGYALASAAINLGASVILISGPTSIEVPKCTVINVITAEQMYQATLDAIYQQKTDYFIATAAVADYRPKQEALQKLKKTARNLMLELEPNQDILKTVANLPEDIRPFVIGFAAETENLLTNAKQKLITKNLDLIIANSVAKGEVFDQDHNSVSVLSCDGLLCNFAKMHKLTLAYKLLELIHQHYAAATTIV